VSYLPRAVVDLQAPGTAFPPMPDPPPGYVVQVAVEMVSDARPWTAG
jgi:hypothetical protein